MESGPQSADQEPTGRRGRRIRSILGRATASW